MSALSSIFFSLGSPVPYFVAVLTLDDCGVCRAPDSPNRDDCTACAPGSLLDDCGACRTPSSTAWNSCVDCASVPYGGTDLNDFSLMGSGIIE